MWKTPVSAALRRSIPAIPRGQPSAPIQAIRRGLTTTAQAPGKKRQYSKASWGAFTAFGVLSSVAAYHVLSATEVQADVPVQVEVPIPASTYYDHATSQHLQVIESWKRPGVYAWGYNKGKVININSDENYIRTPRRLPFFDNALLRDLKLDSDCGVAVDEKGDVHQWGTAYSKNSTKPELTLAKKNIVSVETSATRIFALSKDGTVYSFPKARVEQDQLVQTGSSQGSNFFKAISLPLGFFEKVSSISAGLDHLLILTSAGRVFSCAASTQFPNRGQLGIQGLKWDTRPKDKPYDTPHAVPFEGKPKITQIATGDVHSLALDAEGKVWVFGDNSHGQLGFDYIPELETRDVPTELSVQGLYPGTGVSVKGTQVAAGGLNSYFVVDAVQQNSGKVIADVWASGRGLWGGLGNGKWTHIQGQPTKIKALSGLVEYDENAKTVVPIRVAYFSVGRTHTAAVLSTHAETTTPAEKGQLHGRDALWWGNNEYYQLGTGRRSNLNVPSYIAPLETTRTEEREKVISQPKNGDQLQPVPQHRLQVTPKQFTVLGDGRKAEVEQRVLAGHGISAVYSKV